MVFLKKNPEKKCAFLIFSSNPLSTIVTQDIIHTDSQRGSTSLYPKRNDIKQPLKSRAVHYEQRYLPREKKKRGRAKGAL